MAAAPSSRARGRLVSCVCAWATRGLGSCAASCRARKVRSAEAWLGSGSGPFARAVGGQQVPRALWSRASEFSSRSLWPVPESSHFRDLNGSAVPYDAQTRAGLFLTMPRPGPVCGDLSPRSSKPLAPQFSVPSVRRGALVSLTVKPGVCGVSEILRRL